MLGFILSKMNLLIMVTAIFAIVAYFVFFLNLSLVGREAQTVLNGFVEETYGVLSSTGQCHQTIVTIPSYIRSVGSGEVNNRLRFLVRIAKIPNPQSEKTTISFSILNKKDNKVLAAQPFATDAQVELFNWEAENGLGGALLPAETEPVLINPVSAPPTDSILLVKEVFLGKPFLYVIPCSSDSAWCTKNFETVRDMSKQGEILNHTGGFNCETIPD